MIALLVAVAFQCPEGTPPPCRTAAHAAGPAPNSVAVLYFDNRSRDTSDAYLAEGLTEQTIAQLGEVQRLTVASRFAVRRFRGEAAQDPAKVGRALNVSYLVTGSVQRSGNQLRVGVELVRANTGVRVWGEQYDRTDTDLLRLQDDIASNVATGIVGRLLPAERRAVTARTTRNAQAYDHFLRGNFLLAKRDPAILPLALREYQAAAQLDPDYTDAVARSAYAYGNALDNQFDIGLPRDTLVSRGVALSERALRLDSTSSDAWLASAYMAMGRDPVAAAGGRARFERALALNPRSAEAHHQFAAYLSYMGDTAAAGRENRLALQIEPGRAITWFQLGELALKSGRPRETIQLADSSLAADPDFTLGYLQRFLAGAALGDTGVMHAAARLMMDRPSFRQNGLFLDTYATLFAARDSVLMRQLLELPLPPESPTSTGNAMLGSYGAMLLAAIGERERAVTVLESLRPRGIRLHDLLRYPFFDALRDDPRFIRVWNETRGPGQVW
jgi:TolB-like protein